MATPAPYSVPASEYWEGNDGPWSSFGILVGTPPQNIRVLPSSTNSETWVILPQGCIKTDPTDCNNLRGFSFHKSQSSTWRDQGLFHLAMPVEEKLGYSGNGDYGLDTLSLAWQGSGDLTLTDQIIGGIASKQFYIGRLPLAPFALNLTDFNHPKPSLLASLKSERKVPSLSWSYTAGAAYRPKKPLGSLVLGGYDQTRFTPNAVSFPFGSDISRDLLVGVQAITSGTESLLPTGIICTIDTNVPYIWLPLAACSRFEAFFGIEWDSRTGLYLVNETMHDALVSKNASITFTLAAQVSGGQSVDIVLPYASFDLTMSIPESNFTSRYFPLMRADNDTQYVLGRTLLQESYIIVDYERSNFSVSQARFPDTNVPQKLVAISPPTNTSHTTPKGTGNSNTHHTHKLPIGVIAAIILAAVLSLAVLITVILFLRRRRLRPDPSHSETKAHEMAASESLPHEIPGDYVRSHEIGGGGDIPEVDGMANGVYEADDGGGRNAVEMSAVVSYELPAHVEMPGLSRARPRSAKVERRPFSWEE